MRAKVLLQALCLMPLGLPILLISAFKAWKWRSTGVCRRFMAQHPLAFSDADAYTLTVEAVCGGISNGSYIWRCARREGEELEYFVKVYLPLGSLWARILPWISPFPPIYPVRCHERAGNELAARCLLNRAGIPVPGLVLFDPVACVTVVERLRGGIMVNEMLQESQSGGGLGPTEKEALFQCGLTLARVHQAGLSLIDAQPANCMWMPSTRQVYLLDLEYCASVDHRLWDFDFFRAFVSAQLSGRPEGEALDAFQRGYRAIDPRPRAARGPSRLEQFLPVFRAILDLRRLTQDQWVAVSVAGK